MYVHFSVLVTVTGGMYFVPTQLSLHSLSFVYILVVVHIYTPSYRLHFRLQYSHLYSIPLSFYLFISMLVGSLAVVWRSQTFSSALTEYIYRGIPMRINTNRWLSCRYSVCAPTHVVIGTRIRCLGKGEKYMIEA